MLGLNRIFHWQWCFTIGGGHSATLLTLQTSSCAKKGSWGYKTTWSHCAEVAAIVLEDNETRQIRQAHHDLRSKPWRVPWKDPVTRHLFPAPMTAAREFRWAKKLKPWKLGQRCVPGGRTAAWVPSSGPMTGAVVWLMSPGCQLLIKWWGPWRSSTEPWGSRTVWGTKSISNDAKRSARFPKFTTEGICHQPDWYSFRLIDRELWGRNQKKMWREGLRKWLQFALVRQSDQCSNVFCAWPEDSEILLVLDISEQHPDERNPTRGFHWMNHLNQNQVATKVHRPFQLAQLPSFKSSMSTEFC